MHEQDIPILMILGIEIYTTLEHFLDQRYKQNTKWTAQVCNINKFMIIKATKLGNSSRKIF